MKALHESLRVEPGVTVLPDSLHISTRAVIAHLFPTVSLYGRQFLDRLLPHTSVSFFEGRACAAISVQSTHELAPMIGWSYEATHKYVVLFCALNLLKKVRRSGKVIFLINLDVYRPPVTMKALEHLIVNCRLKVQRTASKVRERWMRIDWEQWRLIQNGEIVTQSRQSRKRA